MLEKSCSLMWTEESRKVTVSLRYANLISVLRSRIRVPVWPVHPLKKISTTDRKGHGATSVRSVPSRLAYAEDALRTMSLPEAYAEIVLNLRRALKQMYPHLGGLWKFNPGHCLKYAWELEPWERKQTNYGYSSGILIVQGPKFHVAVMAVISRGGASQSAEHFGFQLANHAIMSI